MASASTTTAPRSASNDETVDLPDPMPPVRPTITTGRTYHRPIALRTRPSAPDPGKAPPPPASRRPLARTAAPNDLLARFGPLITAVRWGTVAIGLGLAALAPNEPLRVVTFGVPLVAYAILRTVRPLRDLSEGVSGLLMVLADVALNVGVVVATGYWSSPYAFCLISAILAAGFARGFGFAVRTAITALLAVSIPYHLEVAAARPLTTVQWVIELLLIALVAGYARRLFGEAEVESALARQANDLLTQLNGVAQTLPESLDLDETVAATITQLRELFPIDVVVVLLREEASGDWTVAAAEGARLPVALPPDQLPDPARQAVATQRAVLTHDTPGFDPEAQSGIYLPLRARSRLIGILVVEDRSGGRLAARELQLGEGVAAQAALALDNARWFSRLRTVGADEERTRIARDLHDRVGQSLAFVSFELDRISRRAKGGPVEEDLLELREQVRRVVTEVRDTLYDLRTDVSERKDLVTTLASYLDRLQDRTGLEIDFSYDADRRLPLRQERELWRIAQEAVTNAVRHADADAIRISWHCDAETAVLEIRDTGRGVDPTTSGRPDAYGLVGMRERAASIGGSLTIVSPPEGGTVVRCEVAA